MRILHVITGLNVGGAELMLYRLSMRLAASGIEQKIVSLLPEGPLSRRIREVGVDCAHLGLRRGSLNLRGIAALRAEIHAFKPDLIHAWMYHACIYARIAQAFDWSSIPVLWSIHHADLTFRHNGWSTLVAAASCGLLSHSETTHIVYCAQSSKKVHRSRGYCRKRDSFIPNGYDPDEFFRNADSGASVRARLRIPSGAQLIGLVGRFHPIKDHSTFLKASRLAINSGREKLKIVLFGEGVDESNRLLSSLVEQSGLRGSVILAGRWTDMTSAYSALDLLVSSSRGEAFPNVLSEAMLCEVPCVATDVGDCSAIVGECGFIVPAGEPDSLAQAMLQAISLPVESRRRLGRASRQRISSLYSSDLNFVRYTSLYQKLVGHESACWFPGLS